MKQISKLAFALVMLLAISSFTTDLNEKHKATAPVAKSNYWDISKITVPRHFNGKSIVYYAIIFQSGSLVYNGGTSYTATFDFVESDGTTETVVIAPEAVNITGSDAVVPSSFSGTMVRHHSSVTVSVTASSTPTELHVNSYDPTEINGIPLDYE